MSYIGVKSGAIAILAAVTFTGFAQAKDVKLLASWSPANKGTYLSETTFIKLVREMSKGKLNIKRSGPEVVPGFQQIQPVKAGVFDLLLTHGAYHYGTTGMGVAMDAIEGDPVKRRATGIWDAADKHYQKHGLKMIAMVPQGRSGYQMILKKPITKAGDIKGLKIRGTITYHPLIKAFGGSPVVIPGGQVYSALEKGVVDGACWPTVGPLDLKWTEVTKYYVRPSFGVSTLLVLANMAKFKALTADEQKVLLSAGEALEKEIYSKFDDLAKEEEAGYKKAGMKEVRFSKANEAKMGGLWSQGIWGLVIKKNKGEAEAFRKLVNDKKMGM